MPTMQKQIIERLRAAVKKTSILAQSKQTGIPYATLHRIVNGGECNSRTLDKLEKHYR